jgi:superfamily I DNA and/or RNA helicase
VAITRAKAKVIIIGNPLCLEKDEKWRKYIQRCRELGTYHGFDSNTVDNEATQNEMLDVITPTLNHMKISKGKV